MAKKKDIVTWEPSTPINYKVVSEGWGSEICCPHCKGIAMQMLVRLQKDLGIWWLCDCGEGISIDQAYENYKEQGHTHSLGYYRQCAWKVQEKLWPVDNLPKREPSDAG